MNGINNTKQVKIMKLANVCSWVLLDILKKHLRLHISHTLNTPLGQEIARFSNQIFTHIQMNSGKVLVGLWYLNQYVTHLSFDEVLTVGHIKQLLVSVLSLADIYTNDIIYSGKAWSKYSSLPLRDIIETKRKVLIGLQYELNFNQMQFMTWLHGLRKYAATMSKDSVSSIQNQNSFLVPSHYVATNNNIFISPLEVNHQGNNHSSSVASITPFSSYHSPFVCFNSYLSPNNSIPTSQQQNPSKVSAYRPRSDSLCSLASSVSFESMNQPDASISVADLNLQNHHAKPTVQNNPNSLSVLDQQLRYKNFSHHHDAHYSLLKL